MKATERVLVVFFALIMIVVSVGMVLSAWNMITPNDVADFMETVNGNILFAVLATVIALMLFLYSIRVMFVSTKKPTLSAALIKVSETGSIRISIDTVNTLAVKFARGVENVRDVRINTLMAEQGVDVYIRAAMTPDANVPEVSQNLQNAIKTGIEEHTGLFVKNVPVYVDNSVDTSK